MDPRIWEDGDHVYIVSPVSPITPGESEIEEFAFAEVLKKQAPNEHLLWLRGQYVEADKANRNGQMWTAGELAIKSLTPNFMPVTVMHDPRTAVGLIADTQLVTPKADEAASVQRSRIDNTLAVWKHRFPEVAEEIGHNYKQGTLMQSMEALSPDYSCGECGRNFHKLPDGSERENWCEHLSASRSESGSPPVRILGNVTFTGTGLIFGTRGAKGAYREAHLDIDQAEIAEFHQETHKAPPSKTTRKVHRMETAEVSATELSDLRKAKEQNESLQAKVTEAETAKAEAETKVETLETEKKQAEDKAADLQKELDEAKEESRKTELSEERLSALGSEFKDALGDFTTKRLNEQAKSLSDEEWSGRLEELEEMSGKKRDATKSEGEGKGKDKGEDGEAEFSKEETARAGVGGNGNGGGGEGGEPSAEQRSSVVGSLISKPKTDDK